MPRKTRVAATLTITTLLAAPVVAQNQLEDAVSAADDSTDLQVQTAAGVQATCLQLVAFDPAENTPQADLLNRCGEMVRTGFELVGQDDAGRSFNWTNNELAASMQQLSGEEQASQSRLATESSNGQFANLALRMDAIRKGARFSAGGMSLALQGAPVFGGNAGEHSDGGGWSWFLNGAAGFGDRDATRREDEYEYDAYGATFGADFRFDSGLVLGAAFGYSDFEVDFQSSSASSSRNLTRTVSGGSTESDGFSVSGYGVNQIGRFFVEGVLTWSNSDFDTRRRVAYSAGPGSNNPGEDRTMLGSTESDTLAIGASIGTPFDFGAASLYVEGGLNYLDLSIDAYEEIDTTTNGGLNLGYHKQDVDSLQSRVAATLDYRWSTSAGVIIPYVSADWRHEFSNDSEVLRTYYAAHEAVLSELTLEVVTDDPTEDFVELGLGINAVFANRFTAFIDYRTSLGIDDTSANLITLGIRGAF